MPEATYAPHGQSPCTKCRNGKRSPVLTCSACGGLGFFRNAHPQAGQSHGQRPPDHIAESVEHPRWGLSATIEALDRNMEELARIGSRWSYALLEDPIALRQLASEALLVSRSIAPNLSQLGELIRIQEDYTR